MTTGLLFDPINPAPVADTSLAAFEHVSQTLQEREILAFLSLCHYLEDTGHSDATGGEIAEHCGIPVTSIRPRLTKLEDKGWVRTMPARASRAKSERSCHPYIPLLPKAAIQRLAKKR